MDNDTICECCGRILHAPEPPLRDGLCLSCVAMHKDINRFIAEAVRELETLPDDEGLLKIINEGVARFMDERPGAISFTPLMRSYSFTSRAGRYDVDVQFKAGWDLKGAPVEEKAMDNDKLLKVISTTLETLAGTINTALAGSRPPCEVPCASTGCSDNTDGICTGPETCARGYIKPLAAAKGVCSEPCINIKCGYMKGGTCLQPATCSDRITPPQDVPVEELLQGYTLAQWDEIRKGGYLCQFCNVTNDGRPDWKKPVAKLVEIGRKWGNGRTDIIFTSESGKEYAFCRPAQIPGVLRPWFGGDCPVDPEAVVLIKLRGGSITVVKGAAYVGWGHNGAMAAESEVIAYMEV